MIYEMGRKRTRIFMIIHFKFLSTVKIFIAVDARGKIKKYLFKYI